MPELLRDFLQNNFLAASALKNSKAAILDNPSAGLLRKNLATIYLGMRKYVRAPACFD
jgi:hypothetical protein